MLLESTSTETYVTCHSSKLKREGASIAVCDTDGEPSLCINACVLYPKIKCELVYDLEHQCRSIVQTSHTGENRKRCLSSLIDKAK
jgi:hypothetical protein